MLDERKIASLLEALRAQMGAAALLPTLGASGRLDHLVARLEANEFLRLRSLPAFWELLALWEVAAEPSTPCEPRDDEPHIDPPDEAEGEDAGSPAASQHESTSESIESQRLPHPPPPWKPSSWAGASTS